MQRRQFVLRSTVLASLVLASAGNAQELSETLRIFAGFSPGGTVDVTARRLAERGTVRSRRHCSRYFPKTGLARSRRCRRGEERAKQAAASNRKGVVGISGKKAPRIARPEDRIPAASRTRRW